MTRATLAVAADGDRVAVAYNRCPGDHDDGLGLREGLEPRLCAAGESHVPAVDFEPVTAGGDAAVQRVQESSSAMVVVLSRVTKSIRADGQRRTATAGRSGRSERRGGLSAAKKRRRRRDAGQRN